MIPGEFLLRKESILCNEGKETVKVNVLNRGDRPIQIGSHFHFFEVNPYLEFDREQARGRHLNIPAGTAVRFEPGDEKEVELVAFSGERKIYGLNNLVNGRAEI
ncbi:urease subunit beta [Halobacillus massiliensis]|uniref:urease subunit beta n=1 Tax=Halobacillus massiliensis TaxID=1926286 RepID=UPI0009E3B42B|nr:urease subunit beta [Halobacillus massiliensis]